MKKILGCALVLMAGLLVAAPGARGFELVGEPTVGYERDYQPDFLVNDTVPPPDIVYMLVTSPPSPFYVRDLERGEAYAFTVGLLTPICGPIRLDYGFFKGQKLLKVLTWTFSDDACEVWSLSGEILVPPFTRPGEYLWGARVTTPEGRDRSLRRINIIR